MNIPFSDSWVLLRFQALADDLFALYFEDDQGNKRSPLLEPGAFDPSFTIRILFERPVDFPLDLLPEPLDAQSPIRVYLPTDFDGLIEAAIDRIPQKSGDPDARFPVPLPIFISAPEAISFHHLVTQGVLNRWLRQHPYPRIVLVNLPGNEWNLSPHLNLPLRILAEGRSAFFALAGLTEATWYKDDLHIPEWGLKIEQRLGRSYWDELEIQSWDVVVVEDPSWVMLSHVAKWQDLERSDDRPPRLVIYLDDDPDRWITNAFRIPLPPSTSLLWTPLSTARQFLQEFFLGIVHDYPLHEAAFWASLGPSNAEFPMPLKSKLIADPFSNQNLRLSVAANDLAKNASGLNKAVDAGDFTSFMNRVSPEESEALQHLWSIGFEADPARKNLGEIEQTKLDFQRETWGLGPLARAQMLFSEANLFYQRMYRKLQDIANNPDLREIIYRNQRRRVDVTLDCWEEGIFRPAVLGRTLATSQPCQLRLHIGNRSKNSLVVGEIPAIDPLLPEPEGEPQGYYLEVAVFEKDFSLLSDRVQTLYLPRYGGSDPVVFELMTPGQEMEAAELRIAVYHQNHMLQSFLLRARVTPSVIWDESPQVTVQLDFSRTERFTNLDYLARRELTIGVNQNFAGTHAILVKKDRTAQQTVNLTETQIKKSLKDFRKKMEAATTLDGQTSRFNVDLKEGTTPIPEFDDVVRDLADFGRELWDTIFTGAYDKLKDEIRQIRDLSNQTIQIVRHDANFVFPWTVLYDYNIPESVEGESPAPVCIGNPFPGSPPTNLAQERIGCPHNPYQEVYCIDGFWGVRNRIEQIFTTGPKPSDAPGPLIERQGVQDSMFVSLGVEDQYTQHLKEELLKQAVHIMQAQEEFIQTLWHPQRPAVAVILSHLKTDKTRGEPKGPRLLLVPQSTKWLKANAITKYEADHKRLDSQPRPVVLLLACSSGATDVGTLNDFVKSLNSAGVSAVVGTECSLVTGLAARFTREVAIPLWKGQASLGEALQAFNRRLLRSGVPLAFVFTCLGNADFRVKLV